MPHPTYDPADLTSDHAWPRVWTAHWLGALPQPEGDGLPHHDAYVPGGFTRTLFRGSVTVPDDVTSVPVRVTADSRYELFVNGHPVGRGPVRSQPRRQRYDSYDVAPLLHPGHNQLVVLVTYYGTANSFWQPAPGTGNFGKAGVLALEVALPDGVVGTGPGWEVLESDAWTQAPQHGPSGVPVEILDARLVVPDWPDGSGGGWQPAHVQAVTHLGGLARSCAPTDPYGPLLPRPVGPLGGEVVRPVAARTGTFAETPTIVGSPVDQVRDCWPPSQLVAVADPADCALAAGGTHGIELDFGRIVAGRVAFELEAPEGTVVSLLYRESPPNPKHTFAMSIPRTGARYVARGSDDWFVAQESNGLRYAHVVITAPPGPVVRLTDFRVMETLQPAGTHWFRSSDPELDALYKAGVRTVQLNAQDAYIDCPTREQRAWVGDAVVHAMVTLTTSDDWRPPRWYIELGNSPRYDGILPMSVVSESEAGQTSTIPDWSLYWIHGVHTLLRYTADRQLVARAAPTARRILEWYVPYLDDSCLIGDVPEWNLVDWSSILLSGRSSILTAFWANALREYAEIADFLDNAGDAAWARGWYAKVRVGYEAFWDSGRGTYVDHLVDGVPQRPASQIAGALAVVSGLAPEDRWQGIVEWIGDPSRQVIRSWIGGTGGYDITKILEQVRGVQRIDWDADTETVVAMPFAAFLVHDAYAKAGRPDLMLTSLRRWSFFLADGYDTMGENWGWGTPVHGWSSTPTRDLVQVFLGVTPEAPGFTTARVAPAYGQVATMSGSAPTPYGPILVTVDGEHVTVTTPVPAILVRPDGTEVEIPAGADWSS